MVIKIILQCKKYEIVNQIIFYVNNSESYWYAEWCK